VQPGHRRNPGMRRHRRPPPVAHAVDHHHLVVDTRVPERRAGERRRDAAPGRADHQQVTVGRLPRPVVLSLLVGPVETAEHPRTHVGEQFGQRVAPRARRPDEACRACRRDELLDGDRGVDRPGALERHQITRPQTQHGPPRVRASQRRRRRVADHVDGLGRVVQSQRDPQVGVGADLVAHHPRRPLGGEDQVHAETPAAPCDVDEGVQQRRVFERERGELVDQDDQPGHQRLTGALTGRRQVGAPELSQHLFAACHLRAQAAQDAPGQSGLEVGHHAGHVRQSGEVVEGGAALEVDQHERQPVRWQRERRRQHQRSEQLALARTGGARDQAVRAVAHEVEVDGAIGRGADRCGPAVVDRERAPPLGDRGPVDRSATVVPELLERHHRREPSFTVVRCLGVASADQGQRGAPGGARTQSTHVGASGRPVAGLAVGSGRDPGRRSSVRRPHPTIGQHGPHPFAQRRCRVRVGAERHEQRRLGPCVQQPADAARAHREPVDVVGQQQQVTRRRGAARRARRAAPTAPRRRAPRPRRRRAGAAAPRATTSVRAAPTPPPAPSRRVRWWPRAAPRSSARARHPTVRRRPPVRRRRAAR
jgi:hypothetical protein